LNVLKILNKINRLDIAVIKGNEHPLNMEKHEFAEEFHGKNGLEVDWELPS
jgi:inosine-uridine nucleoside N-ribohydrolase